MEELEEIGGNMLEGDEDLEALARQLNSAGGARRVEKAMRDADKILGNVSRLSSIYSLSEKSINKKDF